MEIGPIFRSLMYNKARFWLITLEVALTLAIVANCVNMMQDQRRQLLRPSGLDEAHIVEIRTEPFSESFKEADFRDAQREIDLERLRALPGVRAATAISYTPLGGGGSITSRRAVGTEFDEAPTPTFDVANQAIETLGLDLVAGRNFETSDWPTNEVHSGGTSNVIITQHLADRLFPDGRAVGRSLESDDGVLSEIVVGVVRRMHCAWPRSSVAEDAMLLPGKPGWEREVRYLVRAEAGATDAVLGQLEPAIREANPDRIVTVRTMAEIKARSYDDNIVVINVLGALIVVLVSVTSLGIVGLTSFSVTQRTRQIGTRRALGATRADILRYFLVENWIITGIGLVLGSMLTVGLNMTLTHLAGAPKMAWPLLVGGAVLLWLAGQAAAAVPALRATMVSPELATRTV